VNAPQAEAELQALRHSVQRGRPFGDGSWIERIVHRLALETTVRPRGRPRKPQWVPDTNGTRTFVTR